MKYFIIMLFCGFCTFSLQAQKQWTLKECVDYALENNIQLKQSKINLDVKEQDQKSSFGNMLPNLNGSASHNYFFGRSIDPTTNAFTNEQVQSNNFSLSTRVTLFDGFQLQNSLKRSKLQYLAGNSDLEKAADDISLNVIASFLQVLYSEELTVNAGKRSENLIKQKDKTSKLVDAGSLAKGSLLDVEAQVANEELNLVNAKNQLSNSLLTLTQLLELTSTTDFDVSPPLVELPDQSVLNLNPEQIFSTALQNLPEIKSSEYNVQSAEKSLQIAKSGAYPTLSLFGAVSTNYSDAFVNFVTGEDIPFSDQLDNNRNQSFGLSLSIPIFNGWFTNTSIAKARLGLQNAQYGHQLVENSVFKSIQQAHNDAIGALKKYQASEKSVKALNESFTYTEKKFNVGLLTALEYLTATNNLAIAESELLQAKYDFIFRIKILEFYNGNPLTF